MKDVCTAKGEESVVLSQFFSWYLLKKKHHNVTLYQLLNWDHAGSILARLSLISCVKTRKFSNNLTKYHAIMEWVNHKNFKGIFIDFYRSKKIGEKLDECFWHPTQNKFLNLISTSHLKKLASIYTFFNYFKLFLRNSYECPKIHSFTFNVKIEKWSNSILC